LLLPHALLFAVELCRFALEQLCLGLDLDLGSVESQLFATLCLVQRQLV
jgi:hypothetical protein